MRLSLYLYCLVLMSLWSCTTPSPTQWSLGSPNKKLSLQLHLQENKTLLYWVSSQLHPDSALVVEPSRLGLSLNEQPLRITGYSHSSPAVSERASFAQLHGKASRLDDVYEQQTHFFTTEEGYTLGITLRAYDDGVAFRYSLEGDTQEAFTVTDEHTTFRIPSGKAWIQPYDTVTQWTPGYEKPFEGPMPVGTTSPHREGWAFPMLFEVDAHWLLVTEAALDANYVGMHLEGAVTDGHYTLRFPEAEEAMGLGARFPTIRLPFTSPWRVCMVGNTLGTLVASDLVQRLAPATQLKNTDWVRPGRVSWSWWSDHDSPQNPAALRTFIDLAADMGWEYSLIDANWNTFPEDTLRALLSYASERGVGAWLWYNSGGLHNIVTEAPRDRMHERTARRAEFARLREWGVVGVKIDFFQSDKQDIIRQYIEIMEDAAEFEILLNFHGCTLPRGWERTYPHLLTMEAVRGAETYSFNADWPAQAPVQNTLYTFTRNVVGAMDYTPVTFSNQTYPHITTQAHELALAVLFESGTQHFADRVSAYQNLPPLAKQFLQDVPVAWDETRLLDGYPGERSIIARRKGAVWYVGGINGQSEPLVVDLAQWGLQGPNGTLTLFTDEATQGVSTGISANDAADNTRLTLLPFGGFVAVYR